MEGNQVGESDARVESPRFGSRGGCWDQIPAHLKFTFRMAAAS
jgi:hypothetical protein